MSKCEDDAWRTASLQFIGDRLVFVDTTCPEQRNIDRAEARLIGAREWVAKIDDHRMRKECERWCEASQRYINEARENLNQDRRVREILQSVKRPPTSPA